MLPPVYIAVLAYGGKKWLEAFLPKLLRTEYPDFTVWVIDNASTPPLDQWVAEQFPQVKVVRYETNEGYAGGYQRFFAEYGDKVPYIALLNSDVEVTPGWLSPLIERMEGCPTIGAIQPKIRAWAHREAFEYAGAAGGLMDAWGYPTCRGRGEIDKGQYEEFSRIFWAGGAAFVIRTQAIRQDLGGLLFKPYYFMHMEEIDLCWRLNRAGWMIAYEPRSIVYHVGGGSLAQSSPQKTYYNFRNSLYLLWENLPFSERRWRVLWRMILDMPAALYLLLRGGVKHFWAVVQAHRDFRRYLSQKPVSDELPRIPYRKLVGVLNRPLPFTKRPLPTYPLSCP